MQPLSDKEETVTDCVVSHKNPTVLVHANMPQENLERLGCVDRVIFLSPGSFNVVVKYAYSLHEAEAQIREAQREYAAGVKYPELDCAQRKDFEDNMEVLDGLMLDVALALKRTSSHIIQMRDIPNR